MTSDEVLSMPGVPKRAAIIGGGVIGCEFASMMSDLGTAITILEALRKILPGLDKDVTSVIDKSFTKRGMPIPPGVQVEGHTPGPGAATVPVNCDDPEVDATVLTVGRRPSHDDRGHAG